MKLSDLELLVVSIRAQSKPGTDPNVTFYKNRDASDPKAGPLESNLFIEFDFNLKGRDPREMVWENKVVTSASRVRSQPGDFNLPLVAIDFYTRN